MHGSKFEEFNRQVKTNIIRSVHFAYFNYLKSSQLMDVARSNLMSSQQQLALAEQKYALGSAKKTDLLKAEVRFGQARVDVVNNDAALQRSYRVLKNAMGLIGTDRDFGIEEVETPLENIPEIETGFEIIQKFNPSVKAKQYQITGAELNAKIAKGDNTFVITMPNCLYAELAPIVYTIPLQLLAYHVAVLKGTDVDQPRNLAKSVTVEL